MSSTIIPTMRYDDPKKAIQWLCDVFGFEKHQVYEDDKGSVIHAELKHGAGLIMIGPNIQSEFGKYMRVPKQVGGVATQSCFVIVADPQVHFEKTKSKGAEILMPLEKKDYGASDYTCRDLEGHLWSFGDYNPWMLK